MRTGGAAILPLDCYRPTVFDNMFAMSDVKTGKRVTRSNTSSAKLFSLLIVVQQILVSSRFDLWVQKFGTVS